MKTALFFNEQDAQLVLTAESEWEQTMLKMLRTNYPDITFKGTFYDCNGGWVRMKDTSHSPYGIQQAIDSLMIRMPRAASPETEKP